MAKFEICIDLQASSKSFLRLKFIVIDVFIFLLHLFSLLNALANTWGEFVDKWRDECWYYLCCWNRIDRVKGHSLFRWTGKERWKHIECQEGSIDAAARICMSLILTTEQNYLKKCIERETYVHSYSFNISLTIIIVLIR